MNLIIKVITDLGYLISPENSLLLYFTILGILVTLISISSSLTKEVRQDLFYNYYIKSKFLISYLIFYLISFIITFSFYVFEWEYLDVLLGTLFIILFAWSVFVIFLFVKNLSRNWFYGQLIRKFKSELKKTKRSETKYQTHTRTEFKSLDDFLKNLTYIETTSSDFIEEIEFVKEVGRITLKSSNNYIFDDFFRQLKKIENPKFFRKLRNSLYDLMWDNFNELRVVINLQNIYSSLSIHSFEKVKEFDKNINSDGLRIKSFNDIRYIDLYEKSTDLDWIKSYESLIVNTINNLFSLSKQTIYLDLAIKSKKRYLLEQLGSMVKVLEHYNHIHGQDFLDNYYNLKYKKDISGDEKKNLDLADRKLNAISELKSFLWNKLSELFYLILYEINRNELSKDFFEVALKIFNIKSFKDQFYSYERFDKLDFLNYDWFEGGAQAIASFNFNKYKSLLSFYQYKLDETLDLNQYGDEHFSKHNVNDLKNALNDLSAEYINKYFEYDSKQLNDFKKKAIKEIDNKIKILKKNKKKYIAETPLVKKYVNNFISDCKSNWDKNQEILKKIFNYVELDNGYKVKNFFGQYKLFDKDWFLESFDKTVALDRSSGQHFGRDQVISKRKNILTKINETFNAKIDKEIIVKDLYSDLKKIIKKNKEYVLFYNSDIGREIYRIPDIQWDRQEWLTASFKINDSKIFLYATNIEESLLFEKESFTLEQYKEGYEKIKQPLVVQVEEIKNKDEIKKIKESNDRFKNTQDVQQNVKIRIAEKFEIKRNKGSKFIRLKR
ncbi:hypothetical protein K9L97_01205 [Candidatus Woesearchaeota archaeon]|nr:hypothetical protein [Candidatus Woesearchaeota archaeon]